MIVNWQMGVGMESYLVLVPVLVPVLVLALVLESVEPSAGKG